MKQLSEEEARRFAEVDGKDRFALVALDPEDEKEIVAVVRYERERGTNWAEYAALVEDRFQGRGLGIGLPGRKRWENGLEHIEIDLQRRNRVSG